MNLDLPQEIIRSSRRHAMIFENHQQLASEYNTRQRISILPADVLINIFKRSSTAHIDLQLCTQERYISQVCRYWRAIALGYPMLWTCITGLSHPHNWFREVFRRTATAPLMLFGCHVDYRDQKELDRFELLLKHASRFKHFEVSMSNGTVQQQMQFWLVFQQPARHLEYFRVFSSQNRFIFMSKTNFLGNYAPALQTLVLSTNWSLDSIPSCFQNLQRLEVGHRHSVPPSLSSTTRWIRYLAELPRLKVLHITKAISEEGVVQSLPIICLPNLIELVMIYNGIIQDAELLSHLDLPSLQTIVLHPRPGPQSIGPIAQTHYERLGKALSTFLCGGLSLYVHRTNLRFVLHWPTFQFSFENEEGLPSFSVKIYWNEPHQILPILSTLVANLYLPISKTERLSLHIPSSEHLSDELLDICGDFFPQLNGVVNIAGIHFETLAFIGTFVPYNSLFPLLSCVTIYLIPKNAHTGFLLDFLQSRHTTEVDDVKVTFHNDSSFISRLEGIEKMYWIKAIWPPHLDWLPFQASPALPPPSPTHPSTPAQTQLARNISKKCTTLYRRLFAKPFHRGQPQN